MNIYVTVIIILSMLLSSLGSNHAIPGSQLESPRYLIGENDPVDATPTPTQDNWSYPPPTETETYEATVEPSATPAVTSTPLPTVIPTSEPTSEPSVTPTATATERTDQLVLTLDHEYYQPGQPVTVEWNIEGLAASPEQHAWQLRFDLPAGFSPIDPTLGTFDPQASTLTLVLTETKGELNFSTPSANGIFVLHATLLESETVLGEASMELGEYNVTRVKKEGGEANGLDGKLKVKFPADALAEDADISIRASDSIPMMTNTVFDGMFELRAKGSNSKQDIHQFNKKVQIEFAYEQAGITKPSYLSMHYYDPQLQEWNTVPSEVDWENRVLRARTDHFSLFSVTDNSWSSVNIPPLDPAMVSDFTGAVSYSIPINVPSGPGGLKPSISLDYNSQSVSGASNKTQAGWPGMGWELNSGAFIRAELMGDVLEANDVFTLTIGNIGYKLIPVAQTVVSPPVSFTDAEGRTQKYVKYIDYRTADGSFLKIRRYCISRPETWQPTSYENRGWSRYFDEWYVWDKTGGIYAFKGFDKRAWKLLAYEQTNSTVGTRYIGVYQTWVWGAAYYQNAAGQKLTFNYSVLDGRRLKLADNGNNEVEDKEDLSFYPTEVVYPDGQTKIVYVWAQERGDYLHEWVNDKNEDPVFHTYNLTSIQVVVSNRIIREYDLQFYADNETPVFPNLTWDPISHNTFRKSLVLKSITECGLDGVAGGVCQPSVTFTYGDTTDNTTRDADGSLPGLNNDMFLTQVNNGQGGSVTFTYEDNPWNPNLTSRSGALFGINPEIEFFATGSEATLVSAASVKTFQLGQRYKIACERGPVDGDNGGTPTSWGQGAQVQYVLVEKSTGATRAFSNVMTISNTISRGTLEGYVVLPSTADQMQVNLRVKVGTRGFAIGDCHIYAVVTPYRVTKKTIQDSITNKTINEFTYTYGTPAVNDSAHSALAAIPDSPYETGYKPVLTADNTEFRGHDWSMVTDRNSLRTKTYFFQNDHRKGMVDRVVTSNSSVDFTRYTTSWASVITTPGDFAKNYPYCTRFSDACLADMEIYRNQLIVEEQRNYGPNGTPSGSNPTSYLGTQVSNEYDSFGNLEIKVERIGTGVSWVEKRTTIIGYAQMYTPGTISFAAGGVSTETTVYLAGLPTYQNLYRSRSAGNGNLESSTCFIYDDPINNGSGICSVNANGGMTTDAPQKGLLTGKRTLLNLANNTYADELYWYDNWGNLKDVKRFPLPGTATQRAATNNEQWISIEYDSTFHARPVKQYNALRQFTKFDYADGTVNNGYWYGFPMTETDPNGAIARAEYDKLGRMVNLYLPGTSGAEAPSYWANYHNGSATQPAWFEVSHITSTGSILSARKIYDGLGRLIQTQTGNVAVQGSTDLQDIIVETEYDDYGRVTKQSIPVAMAAWDTVSPIQRTVDFTSTPYTGTQYHLTGLVSLITAPNNTTTTYAYALDGVQLVTTTTDALGRQTRTRTDGEGQTVQVLPAEGPGVTYQYTAAGLLNRATYGSAVTSISYDYAGRKTGMTDADMGTWLYQYDALGNLARQEDAKHQVTCLYYDKQNRLLGKNYQVNTTSCPTAPTSYKVNYTYDAFSSGTNGNKGIGRRTGMSDPTGTTAWEYDLRGQLIHEARSVKDPADATKVMGTYHTYWAYNSNGSVSQMVYPNQETVDFSYNSQGAIERVSTTATGVPVLTTTYASNLEYDEAGRVTSRTLGNGMQQSLTYYPWSTQNQGGYLASMQTALGANWEQNLTYTYDSVGNITNITDSVAGETLTFNYDALNRLQLADGPYSDNPEYSPTTGNLVSRTGGTSDYVYNDSTHAHAVTHVDGMQRYWYDANGNMTRRILPNNSGDFTLEYDEENRLTRIKQTSSQTVIARYSYDGDGKRVLAEVGGIYTVYIGDYFEAELRPGTLYPVVVPQLVQENYTPCTPGPCYRLFFAAVWQAQSPDMSWTTYHTQPAPPSQATITWRMYYAAGGQRLAVRVRSATNDQLSYLLTDHLGSSTKAYPTSGGTPAEARYSAWGETRYTNGELPTRRKYTGQLEAEVGLYFYNARWFDPYITQFTQPDSIIPDPSNPQDWNRYAYVRYNPIRFSDPSGRFSEDQVTEYLKKNYEKYWEMYLQAWKSDSTFWAMLMAANYGDMLGAPTTQLGTGYFYQNGNTFSFINSIGNDNLYEYQGYGPYSLNGQIDFTDKMDVHPIDTNRHIVDSVIDQPIYQYSENNGPIYTGFHRQVQYNFSGWHVNPLSGDDVPAIFTGGAALVTKFIPVVGPVVSGVLTAFTGGTIANNALSLDYSLTVNFVDMSQYFNAPPGPCYTIPGGHCSSPKLPVRSYKEFIK